MREALGRRWVGWRMPWHLREQNQRKLLQIMPGDFQQFIKSQACKSYALFCELADMKNQKKSPSQLHLREARLQHQLASEKEVSKTWERRPFIWHHIMSIRTTLRKAIAEMLEKFPKLFSLSPEWPPMITYLLIYWAFCRKWCSGLDEHGFSESQALRELYS